MKIRSAVITGANGFIGKALTKYLLNEGAEIWAVTYGMDDLSDIASSRLHIVPASFDEYASLAEKITSNNIDVFFHLAWAGYGAATNDFNVQVGNVKYACLAAECAVKIGAKRFVFADSSHEFLVSTNHAGVTANCSIYGAAKHCAQTMCRVIAHNANMEFVGVLFVNIFGWGDKSSRSTNAMIRKLQNDNSLDLVDASRIHNWTYIDDCIGGIKATAERGKAGKVYYVGGALRTFEDIITDVRDVINPSAELRFGVYQDKTTIDFSQIDVDELSRDTGYSGTADFKESIAKTAEWLQIIDKE